MSLTGTCYSYDVTSRVQIAKSESGKNWQGIKPNNYYEAFYASLDEVFKFVYCKSLDIDCRFSGRFRSFNAGMFLTTNDTGTSFEVFVISLLFSKSYKRKKNQNF